MALRWTFQPRKVSSAIALTSLMDVMTILLVFVLLNYKTEAGGDLPDNGMLPFVTTAPAGSAENDLSESLSIVVSPGALQVGKTPISLTGNAATVTADFIDTLARERNRDGKVRNQIIVQADSRVLYAEIDRIVSAASALGITRLRFLAQDGGGPR